MATANGLTEIVQRFVTAPLIQPLHDQIGLQTQKQCLAWKGFTRCSAALQGLRQHESTLASRLISGCQASAGNGR